jgi:hypothetical protein
LVAAQPVGLGVGDGDGVGVGVGDGVGVGVGDGVAVGVGDGVGLGVGVGVGEGAVTVKSYDVRPVPWGLVTEIGPVVAALGTVAWIVVSDSTVKAAATSLKATEVASVKL